ncbi:MAG: glycosyl hydrolase family 28 protein [Verrucomicrobia bacterium]|nr:glycosyl hydrolase family 28 protein [Verrucomicrobiota bacterium]
MLSATQVEDFPYFVFTFGPESEKRAWIHCKDAQNITLSGKGMIDGQCTAFALAEGPQGFTKTVRWRPAMTCFENVHGMEVRDLLFKDAANWTLHFTGCTNVYVHDIKIDNDLRFPNADGIDPDHCKNVRIERCHIVAADDCVVLKNTAPFISYGDCEDISITDCYLRSASSAFKIGSESCNAFRRIRVERCTIEHSNRGLAIQLRDCGDVEDVHFEDIDVHTVRHDPMWWGAAEPIYVTAHRRNPATTVGSIRRISFNNIRCRGENGIVVYASPAGKIEQLTLSDVTVDIARSTPWSSEIFDVRPHVAGLEIPECTPLSEDTPWGRAFSRQPAAVSIEGAKGVHFDNVVVNPPSDDTSTWLPVRADAPYSGNLLVKTAAD